MRWALTTLTNEPENLNITLLPNLFGHEATKAKVLDLMHSPLPNSQIEFTHIARQVVLYNRKRESAFGMKTQCKQMRVPRTNTSTEVRAQVPKYEYKYPSTNTNTEYKHKYRCFLSTLHAVTLSRDLLTSQTACMHASTAAWPLFIIIHTATNGKHSLAMQPHTFAVARPAY